MEGSLFKDLLFAPRPHHERKKDLNLRVALPRLFKRNKTVKEVDMWCLPASFSYPRVGKLHRRHHCSDSKCCELPILSDCSVILMSHFPHIARHPTISGLFLVQMLRYEMLLKPHCIQAGDKLHQRHLNPMSRHIWFPIHLCIALQPDRNVTNCRN